MVRIELVGLILALALSVAPARAAPLEAYGRLPAVEAIEISPDGKLLAIIATDGEQRNVIIQEADTRKVLTILKAGDQKVRDLQWATPRYLLITVTTSVAAADLISSRGEYALTTYYDLQTKKQAPLLGKMEVQALNNTFGKPAIRERDGRVLAFVQGINFAGGRGQLCLFQVDLGNGRATLIDPGAPQSRGYLIDKLGRPLAQTAYEASTGKWRILMRDGAGWRSVAEGAALTSAPALLGLGRDGKSVLVSRSSDDGDGGLRELGADGVWGDPLSQAGVSDVVFDPADHRTIGVSVDAGRNRRFEFFEQPDQTAWRMVVEAFPGRGVALVSMSNDRKHWVVLVRSALDAPAYALVDMTAMKASIVGSLYKDLTREDIAPVRAVSYPAADGLRITGFLTTPKGREAKDLPLVVLPHGGPAAADDGEFDWWAQALVSRGYAVLQVNYRGSTGFGPNFLAAGFGQWGRKMQTDLSDGVRYLAKQGVIDPKRVCIAGASYGGYAALAGATLDRGVYRCAASVSGPADLGRMLVFSRGKGGEGALRYWNRFMGVDGPGAADLAAISPASQAALADIPILLVHGREDSVVPYEQSRVMSEALRRNGKYVELVTLDGEDHWLSRGDTRLKMLQAVTAFLEKNNPPGS